MNLEADIAWIQKEISKLKDPDLIDVLKRLLKYRKKKVSDEGLDVFLERAYKDLEEGNTKPHAEIKKKYDKWL